MHCQDLYQNKKKLSSHIAVAILQYCNTFNDISECFCVVTQTNKQNNAKHKQNNERHKQNNEKHKQNNEKDTNKMI